MKRNKGKYLFILSYLLSFVCLVFEYSQQRPAVAKRLFELQQETNMSDSSLYLLLFLVAIVMALVIYMVYYSVMCWALKEYTSGNDSEEVLTVSLLASEGVCSVIALAALPFLSDDAIRLVVPIVGLTLLYSLLRGKYPLKQIRMLLLVRAFFYLGNWGMLVFGFIQQ